MLVLTRYYNLRSYLLLPCFDSLYCCLAVAVNDHHAFMSLQNDLVIFWGGETLGKVGYTSIEVH